LSKYNYCESLEKQIENVNKKYNLVFNSENIPTARNDFTFDFGVMAKNIEKAINNECPDLEQNRMMLGGLSHVKKELVKDMDHYCHKIDLAHNYLKTVEKTNRLNEKVNATL
jgi:hypothetical protein